MVKTFFVLSLFVFFFFASIAKEASSAQKVYIHSAEKITPKVDQKKDLRVTILKEYLKRQNSP